MERSATTSGRPEPSKAATEDEFDDKDLIMDFPPLSLASEHDDDPRTNGAA